MNFGTLKIGETQQQTFAVPEDDQPATPSISGDPGFTVESTTDSEVVVEFTAGMVAAGEKAGLLTVGATTEALTATVEHELLVTSGSAGSTVLGDSDTLLVAVTNRTDADATVSVDGDFTVSPTTVPASTGPHAVTVTFTPTQTGARAGTVTAAASGLTGTGAVSGTGVEATPDAETAALLGVASVEQGDDGAGGTKTTYKVHVPSSSTKMHLGAAVSPFASGMDGFGLQTSAKGLLQASGDIGINSTSGDVLIQAESGSGDSAGRVITVSNKNTVIAASGGAYVLGDGGVTISTAMDVCPDTRTSDGLPDPDGMADSSAWASGAFAALDGLIAVASLFRVGFSAWRDGKKIKAADAALGVVSGAAAVTAATLGGFSVANAAGQSWSVPGVTIYGHAGVLIGTCGFGGFYAPAGLVLGSIFPVLMGMDTELLGIRTASLTGKNVQISGWTKIVSAARGRHEVVAGDKITLKVAPMEFFKKPGDDKAELELTQTEITGKAKDHVRFQVGDGTIYVARVTSTGIEIGLGNAQGALDTTKPHATITDAAIELAFKANGSSAKITDGKIALLHAANGFGVEIDQSMVHLHDSSKNYAIKVVNNQIYMQAGSSANALQVAPSGLWFKGSMVKFN